MARMRHESPRGEFKTNSKNYLPGGKYPLITKKKEERVAAAALIEAASSLKLDRTQNPPPPRKGEEAVEDSALNTPVRWQRTGRMVI